LCFFFEGVEVLDLEGEVCVDCYITEGLTGAAAVPNCKFSISSGDAGSFERRTKSEPAAGEVLQAGSSRGEGQKVAAV